MAFIFPITWKKFNSWWSHIAKGLGKQSFALLAEYNLISLLENKWAIPVSIKNMHVFSSILLFNKYLLSSYDVPDSILVVGKSDTYGICSCEAYVLVGKADNKHIIVYGNL